MAAMLDSRGRRPLEQLDKLQLAVLSEVNRSGRRGVRRRTISLHLSGSAADPDITRAVIALREFGWLTERQGMFRINGQLRGSRAEAQDEEWSRQIPEFELHWLDVNDNGGSHSMLEIGCRRCKGRFWVALKWLRHRAPNDMPGRPRCRACPWCFKVSKISENARPEG